MDNHQDPRDQGQPREDVDGWLHARIDPLPPPPGTFDLIKRRVRRRRYRQVAASAAVAAAVAGAVVVVPRVATSVLHVNQNSANGAAANGAASPKSHASQGGTGSGSGADSTGTPAPIPTPTLGAPVPHNFQPVSATFVGLNTGWVIGQAGIPGKCYTQYCTSIARTGDAGKTWTGVPAPQTGYPNGSSGVGQIRFLDTSNGWAFGPQLYATTDGGKTWAAENTDGKRVTALETVGNRAFAIFATCTGSGTAAKPQWAAQCTQFSLYSSSAGTGHWTPVTGAGNLSDGGQDSSASLVLTSTKGYLLAPDGSLYARPVDGTGSWQQGASDPAGSVTCSPGA